MAFNLMKDMGVAPRTIETPSAKPDSSGRKCPQCDGVGIEDITDKACRKCMGAGVVPIIVGATKVVSPTPLAEPSPVLATENLNGDQARSLLMHCEYVSRAMGIVKTAGMEGNDMDLDDDALLQDYSVMDTQGSSEDDQKSQVVALALSALFSASDDMISDAFGIAADSLAMANEVKQKMSDTVQRRSYIITNIKKLPLNAIRSIYAKIS